MDGRGRGAVRKARMSFKSFMEDYPVKGEKEQEGNIDVQEEIKSVTESIKRGREEELLFQKTLTSLDCYEFLAISTANALAHFPSLQTSELGEYSGVETLRMVPLKTPEEPWNLKFIYCQNRKSYGIFDGWSDFVQKYKLKEGEMVELYKSTVLDKEYLIDFHKTGNENEEMPLVVKKTIHMYGYDLEYLFEKELSRADVSWLKLLEIPAAEAQEHLPPLKQADGSYKEMEYVLVYDAGKKLHWMEISKRLFGIYYIFGQWDDFVSLRKLCDKDIIRFFKLRLVLFYMLEPKLDLVFWPKKNKSKTSSIKKPR